MKPQTGDIVVVLDGKWTLAKLIQLVTRSQAHHTGILVEINGTLYVSEMEQEGHIFTEWAGEKYNSGFPVDRTVLLMRYKGEADWSKLYSWCLQNESEYDFAALIQHVIFRYLRIWIGRRKVKAAGRMTCSEWVGFTLNKFTWMFPKWYNAAPANIATDYPDKFFLFSPDKN